MNPSDFKIIEFKPELGLAFKEINEEWIREMFSLESKDQKVLNDPQGEIIAPGGHILFISFQDLGIVGTGALLKTGPDEYELTKMGVLKRARGKNAGGLLLQALINKAEAIGVKNLYLLTNTLCASAIHLYEKHGFQHDQETMNRFGKQYGRCNIAMRYSALR